MLHGCPPVRTASWTSAGIGKPLRFASRLCALECRKTRECARCGKIANWIGSTCAIRRRLCSFTSVRWKQANPFWTVRNPISSRFLHSPKCFPSASDGHVNVCCGPVGWTARETVSLRTKAVRPLNWQLRNRSVDFGYPAVVRTTVLSASANDAHPQTIEPLSLCCHSMSLSIRHTLSEETFG